VANIVYPSWNVMVMEIQTHYVKVVVLGNVISDED